MNPDLERDGLVMVNVHKVCGGEACIIHAPTDHHMREWTLHWRSDRGIFERICPTHGTGHPDPDQFDYWDRTGQDWQEVHGCCGCCQPSQAVTEKPKQSGYQTIVPPPHRCSKPDPIPEHVGKGSTWRCDECDQLYEPGGRPSWIKSVVEKARAPWWQS